jgi:hypothetical protein
MAHSRYRYDHKKLRRRYQRDIDLGYGVCCRCSQPIYAGMEWHLDHAPDGRGYLGPAHKRCNLRAGGLARMRLLDGKPAPEEKPSGSRWSRHWYGGYDERCRDCRELGEACETAREGEEAA